MSQNFMNCWKTSGSADIGTMPSPYALYQGPQMVHHLSNYRANRRILRSIVRDGRRYDYHATKGWKCRGAA